MNKRLVITVTKEDTDRPDVLDAIRCARDIQAAVRGKYDADIIGVTKTDLARPVTLAVRIKALKPVCVFNLFEGFSDDSLQEAAFVKVLEKTNLPFTGNHYKTILNCLNKETTRRLLVAAGVATPRGVCVKSAGDKRLEKLQYPLFLKPSCEDASVGIGDDSLAENRHQLEHVLPGMINNFPKGVMVEEFIGGREYNCAFLGNGPYESVGISVIDYTNFPGLKPFLTYKAKWDIKSREFKVIMPTIEESLDKVLKRSIIGLSRDAASALGCRGYFRVDLRQRDGQLYVLDVNPNPDINVDSGFVRQAERKGYSFQELVYKIVKNALKR